MSRRNRFFVFAPCILFLLLIALVTGTTAWQMRRQRISRDLILAIKSNNMAEALDALRQGADPNARDNGEEAPPAFWKVVQSYLHPQPLPVQEGSHLTALQMAAEDSLKAPLVKTLLEAGANPNVRDQRGETPLHAAADNYAHENLRLLLQARANASAADEGHLTPLHYAARHSDLEAVRLLLEHHANINTPNGEGDTPLMLAAQQGGAVKVVKLLLERGADVHCRNHRGESVLSQWIQYPSEDSLRLLRNAGATR